MQQFLYCGGSASRFDTQVLTYPLFSGSWHLPTATHFQLTTDASPTELMWLINSNASCNNRVLGLCCSVHQRVSMACVKVPVEVGGERPVVPSAAIRVCRGLVQARVSRACIRPGTLKTKIQQYRAPRSTPGTLQKGEAC
jgi:hypothetical protein